MEHQDLISHHHHHHHSDASRPSLGFPLGTALLLIIIFCLSGFFSCCYHWDKLRSLRRSFAAGNTDLEANMVHDEPSKSTPTYTNSKQIQIESLPVIMPGDNMPKFIAMPCPCEPPRQEKVVMTLELQKLSLPLPLPPPLLPPPIAPTLIVYNHIGRFGLYTDGS